MYSPPGLHRPCHSLHIPTNVWGAEDHESLVWSHVVGWPPLLPSARRSSNFPALCNTPCSTAPQRPSPLRGSIRLCQLRMYAGCPPYSRPWLRTLGSRLYDNPASSVPITITVFRKYRWTVLYCSLHVLRALHFHTPSCLCFDLTWRVYFSFIDRSYLFFFDRS